MSTRAAYKHVMRIGTRWKDNDIYGHVNNVEYYSYFDTVINAYLIGSGALDIHHGAVIGLCAESHCKFLDSLAFPQGVDAGLRVAHLGKSSVRYEIGLFAEDKETCAAQGWFVHVFVDRVTRKSTPLPDALRSALAALQVEAQA
ncbi:MAG: thioesterase family protein [Stagnimonas sp.]|nr:thioesterase family protein [Stagnimonas sp.]